MKSGDYVTIDEPVWAKTYGQGKPPEGLTVTVNGTRYFYPWGTVCKLSSQTDPDNKVGNPDGSPYPLLHTDFAQQISDQLTIQQTSEEA